MPLNIELRLSLKLRLFRFLVFFNFIKESKALEDIPAAFRIPVCNFCNFMQDLN